MSCLARAPSRAASWDTCCACHAIALAHRSVGYLIFGMHGCFVLMCLVHLTRASQKTHLSKRGFDVDIPRDFTAAMIKRSAADWDPFHTKKQRDLWALQKKSRDMCRSMNSNYTSTGGWCLRGQKLRGFVQLDHNESYALPKYHSLCDTFLAQAFKPISESLLSHWQSIVLERFWSWDWAIRP